MTGIYLFEAKSIQSYLGRSGRLKNVVDVSDSLSDLIDEEAHSKLGKVMETAGLLDKSDLANQNKKDALIHFIRAKGGSFYCWSDKPELLERLRSFWLLYFQEAFPEMAFTDTLTVGDEDFHMLLDKAFKELQTSRNDCPVTFPCATAIVQSTPRTGSPAVISVNGQEYKDLCTIRMESDINSRKLKYELYKKALGPDDIRDASAPTIDELIKEFKKFSDRESDNDIALIHMDGNGMGQTLMALRDALDGKPRDVYTAEMRKFSGLLDKITVSSVQKALSEILKKAQGKPKAMILRPLVIGGDDVTLLIEPCYAYDFAIKFAAAFYKKSQKSIEEDEENAVLKGALTKEELPHYLTASGGILFNKKKHPFFNSIRIVEGLAEMAKKLTKLKVSLDGASPEEQEVLKGIYRTDDGKFANKKLYSAVAVHRMSLSATLNAESLVSTANTSASGNLITGSNVFFVNPEEFPADQRKKILTLADIANVIELGDDREQYGLAMSAVAGRIRRITGHMMNDDTAEWKRELTLFRRNLKSGAAEENEDGSRNPKTRFIMEAIGDFMDRLIYAAGRLNRSREDSGNYISFFVRNAGASGKKFTIFNDLVIANHYINENYDDDRSDDVRNPEEDCQE